MVITHLPIINAKSKMPVLACIQNHLISGHSASHYLLQVFRDTSSAMETVSEWLIAGGGTEPHVLRNHHRDYAALMIQGCVGF